MKLIVEEWNDNTGFEYRGSIPNPQFDAQVWLDNELSIIVRALFEGEVVAALQFNNSFDHGDEILVYGRLVKPKPIYETYARWRIAKMKQPTSKTQIKSHSFFKGEHFLFRIIRWFARN